MNHGDQFMDLLLRYTAGEDVLEEVAAAIAIDLTVVYRAWGPARPAFSTIPRELWVWCFRQTCHVADSPVLLYRGCPDDVRLGISWTADIRVAELFSRMDNTGRRRAGNVYARWAQPCEVLWHSYVPWLNINHPPADHPVAARVG
jgi:hypothetical protein